VVDLEAHLEAVAGRRTPTPRIRRSAGCWTCRRRSTRASTLWPGPSGAGGRAALATPAAGTSAGRRDRAQALPEARARPGAGPLRPPRELWRTGARAAAVASSLALRLDYVWRSEFERSPPTSAASTTCPAPTAVEERPRALREDRMDPSMRWSASSGSSAGRARDAVKSFNSGVRVVGPRGPPPPRV
jgi:hypothetical protein